MCGISGLYSSIEKYNTLETLLNKSLKKLSYRGPDNSGVEKFINQNGCLVLGHTRLSIIDLSDEANQPMNSHDKRYSLVFNGEIYNYIEIRNKLRNLGYKFNTSSDTEVLLVAWQHWKKDCISKLNGMFSFAIYDKYKNEISIVRDAFGIKPLFYYIDNLTNHLCFSSELSSLLDLSLIQI